MSHFLDLNKFWGGQPSPVGLMVGAFMVELLFKRCQDQPIDEFPDVRNKSNGLEDPGFVVVTKVIGLAPCIHKNDRLRKNILSEPASVGWECS
ncbi:MAG TPA: hypothetical protein PK590_03105, partial [Candidatus Omnitrophota bacterium]|nr:hypothetical protein [Candidatus Omnitrophota bacterium]